MHATVSLAILASDLSMTDVSKQACQMLAGMPTRQRSETLTCAQIIEHDGRFQAGLSNACMHADPSEV